jgi:hypothetical protein
MFLRLGTPIQQRQASTEVQSIGGRRRLENELTYVEQRIADLWQLARPTEKSPSRRSRVFGPSKAI